MVSENLHAVTGRSGGLRHTVIEREAVPPPHRAAAAVTAIWNLLPQDPSHFKLSVKRRSLLGSLACAALPSLATTPKLQALSKR